MRSDVEVWFPHDPRDSQSLRIGRDTRSEATVTLVRLGRYLETARSFQERIMKLAFLVTFEGPKMSAEEKLDVALIKFADGDTASSSIPSGGDGVEPYQCYLGGKMFWDAESSDLLTGYSNDNWFPLRRIFPVAEIFGNKPLYSQPRVDNGWYDKSRLCEEARTDGKACRFTFREPPVAQKGTQDIPSRDGYVAIVRDETTFVARLNLHADLVKEVTRVSVQVVPGDQLPQYSLHCGIVQ